jgi:hypothetical protein
VLLGVVVLLLLLLPLLLHAARTPTESTTAPTATAFLENQGRCALTPGSSFLIAQNSSESSPWMPPRAHLRVYTGGIHLPRDKRGEMYVTVTWLAGHGPDPTIVCTRDWT